MPNPFSPKRLVRDHNFIPESFSVDRLPNIDALAQLSADLVAYYQPVNSLERLAVANIVATQASLFLGASLRKGLVAPFLNETTDGDSGPRTRLIRELVVGRAFMRSEIQSKRIYRHAVEEFNRLKALRRQLPVGAHNEANKEIPNEPISLIQPKETKAQPATETKPSEAFAIRRPVSSSKLR